MNEIEQHVTQSPPSGRRMLLPPEATADVGRCCQAATVIK